MERDKMKTDLSALFMARQPSMPKDEAVSTRKEYYSYFLQYLGFNMLYDLKHKTSLVRMN